MSEPTAQQALTPQFCFSSTALRGTQTPPTPLQTPPSPSPFSSPGSSAPGPIHPLTPLTRASPYADFLRLSRGTIDDAITQNLNALVTPSTAGFDPHSTAYRRVPTTQRRIDPGACQAFQDDVLFPSWQARADVLSYCALVATSPDPDDPAAAVRAAERDRERERVVNERLDPYSGRFFPQEARTTQLAMLVRQELGVETIVRARTWGLVKERCGAPVQDWQDALARWRRDKAVGGGGEEARS